ncbi:MAG: 5'/3'-nucleotidase SurE [Planctomycetota bacterium]
MRILITNDDGVDAPGIRALERTLTAYCARRGPAWSLITLAPDRGRSECGHSVSNLSELTLNRLSAQRYSLDGTPVDCVRVALATLASDADIVISGINAGANLGVDLLMSGTMAAAREAAIEGRAALAISHYRRPDIPRTWDHVDPWLSEALNQFFHRAEQPSREKDFGMLWNVNLPAIDPKSEPPEIVRCPVERQPFIRRGQLRWDSDLARITVESDFHGRPREPGSDVDVCFGGQISLSEINPFSLAR